MAVMEQFEADVRLGGQQSNYDLGIAALVVAPFTLTAGVLLSWMIWTPVLISVLATIVLQLLATVWNAGWRARDE